MDDKPQLKPILVTHENGIDEDEDRWLVTFAAKTATLEAVRLVVKVEGASPEEAMRNGRSEVERALRDLKNVASAWKE